MSVHIDEVVSEVQAEPEPGNERAGAEKAWDQRDRIRAHLARMMRDKHRTEAKGYHD
jgi:hypothetical protein